MRTFAKIISTFFPNIDITCVQNNIFLIKSHNANIDTANIISDNLNYHLIYSLNLLNSKKFNVLRDNILNNIFIDSETKQKYIDIFCKAQKHYYSLCKLARLFKIKKARFFDVDTDLGMNQLSEIDQSMIIHIYDQHTRVKYRFKIFDIIQIINFSLSYSDNYFSSPQFIKNPYTNIKFTLAQMYNIYYFIKNSKYIVPNLLHLFYLTNFNLNTFILQNECYIRDFYIKNNHKNLSNKNKIDLIYEMLHDYDYYLQDVVIHPDFPQWKLLDIFKHYLYDFLINKYSLSPTMRSNSNDKLITEFTLFNKLNPLFGRKIYKTHSQHYLMGANNDLHNEVGCVPTAIEYHFYDNIIVL